MKNYLFVLTLFLVPLSTFSQKIIAFEEALDKKSISIQSCIGNDRSTHYLKPLLITLRNEKKERQSIKINAGTYFVSEPENFQDITVMKETIIVFKPQEVKKIAITGVCTEPSNSAPNSKVKYTLGKVPKPEFVEFASFVSDNKLYETSEAQSGMWFLCRDKDKRTDEVLLNMLVGISGESVYQRIVEKLADLQGFNLRIEKSKEKDEENNLYLYRTKYFNGNKLVKEVINTDIILGEKKYQVTVNGQQYSEYSYELTKRKPQPSCEMWGGAMFTASHPQKIRIGMFNKDHVLVREIYYNDNVKPGKYNVKYAYDCEAYPDNLYYFKTIRNDQVVTIVSLSRN